MKSILSITTVILALLFCTTTMAEKVQPLTSGDYQYIVLEDNTAEITKYIGWAEALTVKDTLDGLTVTSIGDRAFFSCSSLTSISLPDSLTSIGADAFFDCSSLTSISLPDSVTSIGHGAFYSCSSLTSISLPDSVTSIGDKAFFWCSSLTSISLPDSVTSIGDWAFSNCPNLTLTVPRDSYAKQYCIDNNILYTYPDALDWLSN